MKAEELRKLTVDEIKQKIEDFKGQLFDLRMKLAMNELTNTSSIKQVRKAIARAYTVLREKQLQGGNN